MNRRRIKLAALSASMILSLGLMVSGVYAATTQGGTISNSVSFTAINVSGSIQYKVAGDSLTTNDGYIDLLAFSTTDASTTTLTISDLVFASGTASGGLMTIDLKIQNGSDSLMYYTYTAGSLDSATNVTLDTTSSASVDKTEIAINGSVTNLAIVYKLTDNSLNAAASLSGFSLVLTSA